MLMLIEKKHSFLFFYVKLEMRKSNSSINHASIKITINKKIQEDSITV